MELRSSSMTGLEKIARGFAVSVRQTTDGAEDYSVSYSPRALQLARGNGGASRRVPADFKAAVQIEDENTVVRWENAPQDPEATLEDFEKDSRDRVRLLHDWLIRLSSLTHAVETWVKQLGWSTKWIEKPLEDSQIGKYNAPCLLMQEETTKVLLEPIARSAPGTEGLVDLYLMPGYDDIASLYYYGNRWNLHYVARDQKVVANIRDAEAKPLTKASLRKILDGMRQNAQ
jgi:hypothetical protein